MLTFMSNHYPLISFRLGIFIMRVQELIEIINGTVLNPSSDLSIEVLGCGAADLMSDVLASLQPASVLLTGLCNPQVIRTAQMADITAVVIVRGKSPAQDTIRLANTEGIPLITTPMGMFEACGRLYQAGLLCLEGPVVNEECHNE